MASDALAFSSRSLTCSSWSSRLSSDEPDSVGQDSGPDNTEGRHCLCIELRQEALSFEHMAAWCDECGKELQVGDWFHSTTGHTDDLSGWLFRCSNVPYSTRNEKVDKKSDRGDSREQF